MQHLDTQAIREKLSRNETPSADEVRSLLAAVTHYQQATAYLASCQAATLESLPNSASKSSRARHGEICLTAAALLDGDASRIRYPADPQHTLERCLKAFENHK